MATTTTSNARISESEPVAAWPADGLETVGACPVCGDSRRELLYDGLTDRVFFCAPGVWTLYRCKGCGSGYLDPRPTRETIGLAYRTYFTHEAPLEAPAGQPERWPRRLKARLRNDYLRHRYGLCPGAAIPLGRLAVYLAIRRRLDIDRSMRHLPKAVPGARLLDIGCGNGQFLLTARALGWEAWGVEPDPDAVSAARSAGLRVEQGGFPDTGLPDGCFDVVTMSHVIEHLHDPVGALREVRRLLKPGGILWIATPNIESVGSRYYGRHWRGFEPPRHLVIFTASSLGLACKRAGLRRPRWRRSLQASWMFQASEQIACEDVDPTQGDAGREEEIRRASWAADVAALLLPSMVEELVAVVRK